MWRRTLTNGVFNPAKKFPRIGDSNVCFDGVGKLSSKVLSQALPYGPADFDFAQSRPPKN